MKIVKSSELEFNYSLNGRESVDVNKKGTIVTDEAAAQIAKVFPFVSVEEVKGGSKNEEVKEEEVSVDPVEAVEEAIVEAEKSFEPIVEEEVAEKKPKLGKGKNK